MPSSPPVVRRHLGVDSAERYRWLASTGRLLTRWPAEPSEASPTDCFVVGGEYWIWQPGVGGIQFSSDRYELAAFPAADVDPAWFDHLVTRSWLPAVYQTWGRQVLHASALACTETGAVLALAGASGAGKSTLAYALANRSGWTQLADDTLAFACEADAILLHPLPNDARLRPATAAHFGRPDSPLVPLAWPDRALSLTAVLLLGGQADQPRPVVIEPLPAAEAYRRLLEQAHAFTLEIADHNRRLLRDYLALTARVPAFELSYRRRFDALDQVLDAVEVHWSALLRTPPARRT
ncbi:MAG TPA: hypothetical protein VMM93_07025 [Vicinamibacterales bacterium]|nr:hypothetical protein [Vicinamibacterales bacterium]